MSFEIANLAMCEGDGPRNSVNAVARADAVIE